MIYRAIFQLVFRWLPPEFAHYMGKRTLQLALRLKVIRAAYPGALISIPGIPGLEFENRLGIAAGFDKNAELVRELYALGFGHVEIGTVTAQPQPGNPRPRLFRLIASKSLINRMGFNNQGAAAIAARLSKLRESGHPLPVIGVNIGKSRAVPNESAASDYQASTQLLAPLADYIAVNVSSPNTPGLRDLQQADHLRPILQSIVGSAVEKPIFVKLAPDLSDQEVVQVASLVAELGLAGLIIGNTSVDRFGIKERHSEEAGGFSGPALASRAIDLLRLVRREFPKLAVISVGGVNNRAEFEERIQLGAELVQIYTAFIYQGPRIARNWLS